MKYFFIYIFLLSLFISSKNTFGQNNPKRSLLIADSLMAVERYDLADIYYEKFRFENKEKEKNDLAFISRNKALINNKEFEKAYLESSKFYSFNNSIMAEVRYYEALAQYLNGNSLMSYLAIQKCNKNHLNSSEKLDNYILLKSLVLADSRKIEELEKHFRTEEIFNNYDTVKLLEWTENYKELKFKKPERAEWFSTFLPGTGQWYAGYLVEGTSSVVLNLFGLSFMGYNFLIRNYFTTFTVGSALLNKFYFGGRRRAKYLAEQKNKDIQKENLEELLSLIKKKGSN